MQKTMQNHAAVFRTGDVMQEGIKKMESVWKDMANLKACNQLADHHHILIHILVNRCLTGAACGTPTWWRPSSCRTA